MPRQRKQFPCGSCSQNCGKDSNSIECSVCSTWVHTKCVPMSLDMLTAWSGEGLAFVCPNCAHTDGVFDVEGAMRRISSADVSRRQMAARSESLLIETYHVGLPASQPVPVGPVDNVAVDVLKSFHRCMLDVYVPLAVKGDGNGMFRAVSLGLFGTPDYHLILRLLSAIEILLHPDHYDVGSSSYVDIFNDRLFFDSYSDLVTNVLTVGGYSSLLTVAATSAVVGQPVQSYCPPTASFLPEPLTKLVSGRGVTGMNASVTLMWTTMFVPKNPQLFMPNHFALLAKKPAATSPIVISLLDDDRNDAPTEKNDDKKNSSDDDDNDIDVENFQVTSTPERARRQAMNVTYCLGRRVEDGPSRNTRDEFSPQEGVGQDSVVSTESHITVDDKFVSGANNSSRDGENSVESVRDESAQGGIAFPRTANFMGIDDVILHLESCSNPLPSIPNGRKEFVFFLVDNTRNVDRRNKNMRSEFCDDCGAWEHGCCSRYLFVRNARGKWNNVVLRDGLLCKWGPKGQKERTFIPLEPQPAREDVIAVRLYYSKLKGKPTYKRRVTYLEQGGIACVEYIGEYSRQFALHGNAKNKKDPYVRTAGEVMEKVGEECRHQPPRAVYNKLKSEAKFSEMAKDLKQVQDKKYKDCRKERCRDGIPAGRGLADALARFVSNIHEDSFLRDIRHSNSKVPSFIFFTNDQIQDIKRFCCSGPGFLTTVLGVDKTYNLSELHLTTTVFKHLGLVRRDTNQHPLFLGPVLLHGNSDVSTFAHFFSTLNIELGSREADPVFGSDAEEALRQGIAIAFPNASLLSCVRHMRNNALNFLQDKVGCPAATRDRILDKIFGLRASGNRSGGLLRADTAVQYEILRNETEQLIRESAAKFLDYFQNTMKPLLDQNHRTALIRPEATPDWTNNNCESMNHVLKMAVAWQPQAIEKLKTTIRDVVRGLYIDAERAFIGMGEYRLVPSLAHTFRRHPTVWAEKRPEQRNLHWQKFMKARISATAQATSTSTDGQLTVLRSASAGKKPCQRKRKRNAKTTTPTRAKRSLFSPVEPLSALIETYSEHDE